VAIILIGVVVYQCLVEQPEIVRHKLSNEVQVIDVLQDATLLVSNVGDELATFRVKMIAVQVTDQKAAVTWLSQNCKRKKLQLEFDKRRLDQDETWLAYIYLEDRFLNAELVRLGFARHARYPGDSVPHAKLIDAAAEQ
jgi:hypothetical protein